MFTESLPSRGAWIEILWAWRWSGRIIPTVAPLAGSVDRNMLSSPSSIQVSGRSPRGERG